MRPLLELKGLSYSIGGTVILSEVTFRIDPAEIVALIGSNGSGKTTVLNCISRLTVPDKGEILLEGRSIMDLPPYRIAQHGIGRVFQTSDTIGELTLEEFIILGRYGGFGLRQRLAPIVSLSLADVPPVIAPLIESTLTLLFSDCSLDRRVRTLSQAQKRYAELMQALMTAPQLLILDELTTGLTDSEREPLREVMRQISQNKISILCVEHDHSFLRQTATRFIELHAGVLSKEGCVADLYLTELFEVSRQPELCTHATA